MRLFVLLFALIVCAGSAYGQPPKTYAQIKREQDWKKYQDDYIEATKYNRNASSNAGTANNENAAQELADQWRRNAGKRTAAEQRAWEAGEADRQAAQRQKERAEAMKNARMEVEGLRRRQERIEREAGRSKPVAIATETFLNLGFNVEESNRFASATVPYADNGFPLFSNDAYRVEVAKAAKAKQAFDKHRFTGSFDELANLVRDFRIASLTAMASWQFLGARFPEYKNFTEREELYSMRGLMIFNTNENDIAKRDKLVMLERFSLLMQKYPAEAINLQNYYRFSDAPFARDCRLFPGTDPALAINTCELYLLATTTYSDETNVKRFRSDLFYGEANQRKWKERTTAYWKKIAELADIPVVAVLERMTEMAEGAWRVGNGHWPTKMFRADLPREEYKYIHAALERLAEEGDLSAVNSWGLYLATRGSSARDRKKGYRMLKEAAAAGSMWAVFNLLFSAEVDNKDAPSLKDAKALLDHMLSTASPQHQYGAAVILLDKLWIKSINPAYAGLAFDLCRKSALSDYAPAQEMLKSPKWKDIGKGTQL